MTDTGTVEERLLSDNIKISLRSMIKSFDSYIKEAKNYDQLEENLKHMEETDENFHKYDLVESITDGIENLLGDSIDKHVNEMFSSTKFDGDIDNQNRTARAICDEILNTKEFMEFKNSLYNNVEKANDYLMKNFHSSFNECSSEVTLNENESKSITFTNDFNEYLSPDDSMNQNSFVFFNSEQFPTIAENLDPRKPEHARLRAIQQLIRIPASDPPAAEFWNKIRKYLINALKDPNDKIADLCLRLHSRTLASSHPTVAKEIYSCLAENLWDFFRDREVEKRALKANIDITSDDNMYLLKHFRLINDYAKEVSKYWIRYSETFVKSIIDDTLTLFDIVKNKFGYYMTPIHYVALIDIDANWFTKWMHGHDSRRCVIESLKEHESIVHQAVYSIYSYSNSKRIDSVHYNHKKPNSSASSQMKRTLFRKCEIEFCHFIHSLRLITKILSFKNGRRLFPVKVSNKEMNIRDLMKCMIQIMFDTTVPKMNGYSPPKYTHDLLLDLCFAEETCDACFCYDDVIDLLLRPIKTILDLKKNSQSPFSESCILYMANVLSKLASTESGYKQLLYGETKTNFNVNKNSAAHTIMRFVRKALNNQLNCQLSYMEIGEYIYLARMLYSQCQGSFLIKEYDLSKSLSDAWKNHSNEKDKVINPSTPRQTNVMNGEYNKNVLFSWSDSLLDNMLCMSATPKGVIYLNETGLLKHVINFMLQRYKQKLQVGKNEKFGYGFMISQIANTPSGSYYLNESNLIQYLVEEIWTELEYGTSDDYMTAFPRSYPSESIDRYVYKPMLWLINILSSFCAIYEILVDVAATPRMNYSLREIPEGVISLIDRVVFIDKDIKIQSLFNYEQTHIFGLKLLSFLQTDLDVLLLFETQYATTQLLLDNQRANVEDDEIESSEIIIDILSVERNYALVQANLIGGGNEKLIPGRTIDNKNNMFTFPMFSTLPLPDEYVKKVNRSYNTDEKFLEFVKKNEPVDDKWLQKARKLYTTAIKKGYLSVNILAEFFTQLMQLLPKMESNYLFNANKCSIDMNEVKELTLSNLQLLGVEKAVDYGIHISQLKKDARETHLKNMATLIKATKSFLRQDKVPKSKLNFIQDYYPGYDWFASTMFILYNGNFDGALNFLCEFQKIYHSSFLWTARLYSHTDVLSPTMVNNGINVILGTTCHYVEYIMQIELPLLFSAFRMSGLAPSQICSHWIKQCFWNYFDWPDVVTYLSVCILFGIDYQVYYCLAILSHLSSKIIEHHNHRDLQFFLKENQIKNFKVEEYFDYMNTLEGKYRQYIISDIKEFFNRSNNNNSK